MVDKNLDYYPLWSLYFAQDGYTMSGDRIMGRQAAGNAYLKAILKSDISNISLYLQNQKESDLAVEEIQKILPKEKKIEVERIQYDKPNLSKRYGGIFFPGPVLTKHAMNRSFFGHESYSLVGITHTTASHTVMSGISELLTYPVKPWDAVICTSDVVLDTVNKILDRAFDQYKKILGATKKELPMLPVIPLGVHQEDFDFSDEFISNSRKNLNINEDDIVIVYVGRLSFHAKAHPVPMYLALEDCAKEFKGKKKIHLIQTGWFANEFIEQSFKAEAQKLCPSIICHFLDGKDQNEKFKTLAAGDIFMSLSDNHQETFGLTPLEGMASGLPVIVSDWNGYRSTVRDTIDGFTIKSYSLGAGFGNDIAYQHMINFIDYNKYVGLTTQRVAIDIKDCILKLKILINDKNKRLELGTNGKKRATNDLSWSHIIDKYKDLAIELNNIRDSEGKNDKKTISELPHDRMDPFDTFSSYPTEIINQSTLYRKTTDINFIDIKEFMEFASVNYALESLPEKEDFIKVLDNIDTDKTTSIINLGEELNISSKELHEIIIVLIKYGYICVEESSNE